MDARAARRSLDSLFRPKRVAIMGATPNMPTRMGTRTLHDLVASGWAGEVYPISSRHEEIYGRRAFASLRQVPAAPDVVLARTPAAQVEEAIADAISVGAGNLVVLASGFAETGEAGQQTQQRIVDNARQSGLRLLGPQSIGLVNLVDGVPLSMSQIMERLEMRAGNVALLSQSGAMAVSLSLRGQEEFGISFSYIVTFGNAADIDIPETLHWLANDANTAVIAIYLESTSDLISFAAGVAACRRAGKYVVVMRPGKSAKGASAVASHTASMAGDARVFSALCGQLSVVLAESGEEFLVAAKGLSGRTPAAPLRSAFASVSGGACALWADEAARRGFSAPDLSDDDEKLLAQELPPFLKPRNPLDLGPAMFDPQAFEASVRVLARPERFDLLAIYMFTSSPTLMGGLERIAQIEALARDCSTPLWVIWEAPTAEEWTRLSRADAFVAFRDLGQAAVAAGHASTAQRPLRYCPDSPVAGPASAQLRAEQTEYEIKTALAACGYDVPRGAPVADASEARRFAEAIGTSLVLKVHGGGVAHKSELGGVVFCRDGADAVPAAYSTLVENLTRHGYAGCSVFAEELIDASGLELFATVRKQQRTGWITTIGRGGQSIEVEQDFAMRVGLLAPADVLEMLTTLRCWPLLQGFRGQPPLDVSAFARLVASLPTQLQGATDIELELNPIKVTASKAWILDALITAGVSTA